ncbi:MAG: hypothetical protein M0D57_10600 [Sphingobacteriales bacterium JAD_PAG50586_3]|nr:MAG: hypothetical protein M0D57_10600 [Sphingobacteriales bacterium JAD_PAG50586_3]
MKIPGSVTLLKASLSQKLHKNLQGKDGDPQLAALRQYLQVLSSTLNSDDVILDVGSGRGVLADSMQKIWKDSPRLPWYYAVDLDELLYDLNLPREIHNHSRKILFSEFLNAQLPCNLKQVKVIVIRNTFHELNIKITAEVLIALRKITRFGAVVYLQDMENLPQGERENAGWHSKLLKPVLEQVGFECGVANREKVVLGYIGIQ